MMMSMMTSKQRSSSLSPSVSHYSYRLASLLVLLLLVFLGALFLLRNDRRDDNDVSLFLRRRCVDAGLLLLRFYQRQAIGYHDPHHQQQQQQYHQHRRRMMTTTVEAEAEQQHQHHQPYHHHQQPQHHHPHRRPVMHTYFASLPVDSKNTSASMSFHVHDTMIQVWEESWRDAGWHTRVLTMDDAQLHPEFHIFDAYIQNFTTDDYNKACYYRWLAMAAVGGGWMSDYDTLPLHSFTNEGFDLPMKGALVVYEGPHVPSLLSGSASEWLRMTKRLLEYAKSRDKMANDGRTVSDMIGLSELITKFPNIYVYQYHVAGSNAIRVRFGGGNNNYMNWTKEQCRYYVPRHLRAAHFSHDFTHNFWIRNHPNQTMDDRPEIERSWLDNWLRSCGRQAWKASDGDRT